jgi:hypothetical protein
MNRLPAVLTIITLGFFLAGCATGVRLKRITPYETKGDQGLIKEIEVQKPEKSLRVGEKLTYSTTWNGIPVGQITFHIKDIVEIKGRKAYHIVCHAKSNRFLIPIYKIDDTIETYMDCEYLHSLKFEQTLRHRKRTKHEVVEFDQINHKGYYTAIHTGEKKEFDIPENCQDGLSAIYYLRTMDFDVGKEYTVDANVDEKNYKVLLKVLDYEFVTIPKMSKWIAFKLQPGAILKGNIVKKGKMWIWASVDKQRIPLLMRSKIFMLGSIYAVLNKIE